MEKGEIPIASVIVDPINERIIARSFNREIASNDPTAHAEILCIRKACKKLNQKRLDGLIMISYLEPCHMCKEVIKSSRLSEVYYLFKNENPKHKYLMRTIDFIQKSEGQGKIKLASQDLKKRWKMKQESLSPNYTCKINEIIKVK